LDAKKTSFRNIVDNLRNSIVISQDKRLISYYSEYLVALKLSELGYDVEVLKKTQGPDLVVHIDQDVDRLVEIKSSHLDSEGWACATSFYKGTSIRRGEFHFCVFVIFEKLVKPVEYLIFTLKELEDVKKERPYPITAFPNNRCVLFRYKNLREYKREIPNVKDRLDIEIKLHKHPEEFRNRWDKIVS